MLGEFIQSHWYQAITANDNTKRGNLKKTMENTTCDTKWTEPVENLILERNEHNTAYIDFK